jgi:hypothetical protein
MLVTGLDSTHLSIEALLLPINTGMATDAVPIASASMDDDRQVKRRAACDECSTTHVCI